MTVVLDRPYQFVPPHRGNAWPSFIQTFRLVDYFLKRREGVVDYECRGLEHWKASLERGDGILLAPNHCRYADPLVLGWPARQLGTHVFAMAAWHLFNATAFDTFAIRMMGGFSINRENSDRASLETAIDILAGAQRPLILFPEGTTNRTNDLLKPLLEGVAFIARSAARRRRKHGGGNVVMLPIAMKYLCVGDCQPWADEQLAKIERRLGWRSSGGRSVLARTIRVAEGLLSLKEIEYLGHTCEGSLPARRDGLIDHILKASEQRLGLITGPDETRARVRAIRAEVVKQHFSADSDSSLQAVKERTRKLAEDAAAADLAQELMSYPDCYLQGDGVTETRIVETIQRMQESLLGHADVGVPLKVIIECGPAIAVPPKKPPRGQTDPIMVELETSLTTMLSELSTLARPATVAGLA